MKSLRLASLALVLPAAAVVVPSQARAIGFGIEGGGTFTKSSGTGASPDEVWTANGGIIVENVFPIAVLFLDLWADVQTPLEIETGGAAASKYVPIDLGLRLGLAIGPIQPYVGVLGQAAILTDSAGALSLNNPLWGLGGDLGLDIAVLIFRFGVELRGIETVSAVASGNVGSAFEFEALASARLSF